MKIKVKAGVLKKFIRQALDEGWTGDEALPTVINEPPLEHEPVIIDPKPVTQVADSDLPVDDDQWRPGNLVELGMAMKQMAERVPDSQIEYLWPRLKLLVEKAIENTQDMTMQPHIEDVQVQMQSQERLPNEGPQ